MSQPDRRVVLVDQTSGANAAADTASIDVTDYESILVSVIPSAAAGASTVELYDGALSGLGAAGSTLSLATPADANSHSVAWGTGVDVSANGRYLGGVSGPLPTLVGVRVGALGIGVTSRIRVIGQRKFKGNDTVATTGSD